jgi:hypothetical protein
VRRACAAPGTRLASLVARMAGRIRLVGSALALFVLLTGCARHQLSVSGPGRGQMSHATDTSAGEATADRVKDDIQSLRRELKRGDSRKPQLLAELRPIPLINTSRAERVVGTAGVWTVFKTTQRTPPGHNVVAQTHTQYRDSPGSHRPTWVLLVLGAMCIAGILALSYQARKHRTRQE